MPRYRIKVEKIDRVPQTEPQWMTNAKPEGESGYVTPPEGVTKQVTETVFDQTVDDLDLAGLVCSINTPGGFGR